MKIKCGVPNCKNGRIPDPHIDMLDPPLPTTSPCPVCERVINLDYRKWANNRVEARTPCKLFPNIATCQPDLTVQDCIDCIVSEVKEAQ